MKVAVLGGGSIGVASAWWLQQAGIKVSVIDRQPQVGLETSRNCGGLISIGQARPWAQPDAPWALFKSLFSDFAPLRLRLQLEPKQWAWLASFVHQSMPRKNRANIFALVRLAEYSRNLLHDLSQELSINYQKRNCGVLSVYRDHKALAQAEHILDRLRDLGIERRLLSPAEVIAVEPSLAHKEHEIIGGDYTSKDSVGDAYLFARALAKHAGKERSEEHTSELQSRGQI